MTTSDEARPTPELSELAEPAGPPAGPDPSNTPVEQIVDPLDDDDDVHLLLAEPPENASFPSRVGRVYPAAPEW